MKKTKTTKSKPTDKAKAKALKLKLAAEKKQYLKDKKIEDRQVAKLLKAEQKQQEQAKAKATKKALKQPKPKIKKKRIKYAERLSFKGLLLSKQLSDTIREIRKKLIAKSGCFYSYNKLIAMSYKHIRYMMFYKHAPNAIYPCDKRFFEVAKESFELDWHNYERNESISAIEDFNNSQNGDMIMYLRTPLGGVSVKRYKEYNKYHEAANHVMSQMWRVAENWEADHPEDHSSIMTVYTISERKTGIILIDFSRATIANYPLDVWISYAIEVFEPKQKY